jgi:hypothetical protein
MDMEFGPDGALYVLECRDGSENPDASSPGSIRPASTWPAPSSADALS